MILVFWPDNWSTKTFLCEFKHPNNKEGIFFTTILQKTPFRTVETSLNSACLINCIAENDCMIMILSQLSIRFATTSSVCVLTWRYWKTKVIAWRAALWLAQSKNKTKSYCKSTISDFSTNEIQSFALLLLLHSTKKLTMCTCFVHNVATTYIHTYFFLKKHCIFKQRFPRGWVKF